MNYLPETIGRYRVITRLGQGGMATAYLAMSRGPGGFRKLSVLKRLLPELRDQREFVAMFLDEARIAALFRHPNIVQTHEVIANGELPFMAMEFLEGQTFSRARRYLDGAQHMHVIAEALTGLHYVHELADLSGRPLHVVHRDISPSNLFVTYDGALKILDFGIAKAAGGNVKTKTGGFKGKISYVAPEQARTSEVDRRADIFSIGVLLWEAIAGRSLVPRDQAEVMTFQNRLNGTEPSIDEIAPEAPKELREVCKKAMALDPNDRYQTAQEFRDALEEAAGAIPIGPSAELAGIMAWRFRAERQTISDEVARAISSDDHLADLDDVPALQSGPDDTWQDAPSVSRSASASMSLLPSVSQSTSREVSRSVSRSSSRSIDRGWLAEASRTSGSRIPATNAPPIADPHPRRHRGAAVSLLGLVVVVAGWASRLLPGLLGPTPAVDPTAVAPAPAADGVDTAADETKPSATANAPGETKEPPTLMVTVEPGHAKLELDGEEVDEIPFVSRGAIKPGKHYLVASAPGYETTWRKFRLENDLELEIKLEKLPSWTSEALRDADAQARGDDDDGEPERSLRRGDREQAPDESDQDGDDDNDDDEARSDRRKKTPSKRKSRVRAERKVPEQTRRRDDRESSRRQARRGERGKTRRDEPAAERRQQRSERRQEEAERRANEDARRKAAADREQEDSSVNDNAEDTAPDRGGRVRPGQSLRKVRKKSRAIDKENPYK